jgi:hypothetical protein
MVDDTMLAGILLLSMARFAPAHAMWLSAMMKL